MKLRSKFSLFRTPSESGTLTHGPLMKNRHLNNRGTRNGPSVLLKLAPELSYPPLSSSLLDFSSLLLTQDFIEEIFKKRLHSLLGFCLGRTLERDKRMLLTDFLQPAAEPTSEVARVDLKCTADPGKTTEVFSVFCFNPIFRFLEELSHRGRRMVDVTEIALDGIFKHRP